MTLVSEERLRFEVLLDETQGQFGVITDGHTALNEKFDRLEGKVDRLDTKVDGLEIKVDVLHADLTTVKVRVGKIEHHLGVNGAGPAPARKSTRRKPTSRKK
jgi:predicted nuclease with TOPRIM domain